VPFFIRWPARIAPGTTVAAPVHHFDLFATAADAAGAPPGDALDGVSLLPYVTGEAPTQRPHETLFWRAGAYRTVREGDWKLAVDPVQDATWLFDLSADPGERVNLAAQAPEVVARLKGLLADHEAEMVPPLWDSGLISPINVDKHLRQPQDPENDTFVYWHN
jgi:arylsulfatase A-like enzyme